MTRRAGPRRRGIVCWPRVLLVMLFLNGPGFRVPGFDPHQKTLPCPRLHGNSDRRTNRKGKSHSGRCPQCGWFIWAPCPFGEILHFAYSFGQAFWECGLKHRFGQRGLLCLECERIAQQSANQWVCKGRGGHMVELHPQLTCAACRAGLPVRLPNAPEYECVACGTLIPAEA
jgi:hypothetical protein